MSCHSTHVGIAATGHARAVTDLDDAQVSSVFHRLKRAAADAPAPSAEEATATLVRMRREVLDDTRLPQATAQRIADRYAHAIEAVSRGQVPDGRTWAAVQQTVAESEIAALHLQHLVRESARTQRTNPDRLAATFRKWRRDGDSFEDIEAPDPAFRPDPADYPADRATARALRKLGFENYLAQRLPVFVYGTLRQGQGNDRLMDGAVVGEPVRATAAGVGVYGADRGFPYALEHPTGQTVGDLVHLDDGPDGDWARNRLDGLEGFNSDRFTHSHYRRVVREVSYVDPATGQERTVSAWTYLAGAYAAEGLVEGDRIVHGDWVQAKREYRSGHGRGYRAGRGSSVDDGGGFTGDIVYKKRATDPAPARSAVDAAAVFAEAGAFEEDPPEDAGFWSAR